MTPDVMESFLTQSKPSTLWGVQLHQHKGVPKGWQDVGGLNQVRKAILETLQYPAKVRTLSFSIFALIFLLFSNLKWLRSQSLQERAEIVFILNALVNALVFI